MVTMLEKAINYVQCLELQIRVTLKLRLANQSTLSLAYIYISSSGTDNCGQLQNQMTSGFLKAKRVTPVCKKLSAIFFHNNSKFDDSFVSVPTDAQG